MFLLAFCTSVLTARSLGLSGRGDYFYFMTLAGFATQFGNLGLASSNTYFLAKESSLLPRLASNSLWVSLLVGLVASAVVLVLEFNEIESKRFGNSLLVMVIMVPSMLYGLMASNLLIGLSLFRRYNFFQLSCGLLQTAGIGLAVFLAWSLEYFIAVSALSSFVSAVILYFMIGKLHKKTWRFDWDLLFSNLSYSGKAYTVTFLSFGVSRAGILLLDRHGLNQDLGIYSVAVQFADALIIIPSTVAMVLFPNLLKQHADRSFSHMLRALVIVVLLMSVLCLVTGLIAAWIIPILFGQEFKPSVEVLWWMLPGVFFLSITTIMAQYLASKGIPISLVCTWGLTLVLFLILGSFLIPYWGSLGAALSLTTIYAILSAAVGTLCFIHHKKEKPSLERA